MTLNNTINIQSLAQKIRIHATRMISAAKSSHLGGNFSMAEIIAVLYGKILNVSPENIDDPNRDRFILSKGHAAAGYYATLAECGFFPIDWLDQFYVDGGKLAGHATRGIAGIEVSSGALGHGLPMAVGMALAAKRDKKSYKIYVLLSDGECNEGSVWEAAMLAAQHQLDNLICIVDYNKIQALGYTKDICDLEPFAEKWKAFRWNVCEVNGHNIDELIETFTKIPLEKNKPNCIIAHTVKGKGVSFMEDQLLWHYRSPQDDEYKNAIKELQEF
ncbi:MAG: transketolase [Planctomycetaceae bacterium]|jgi:transketolase|nr:transketolase [Planctomycetaceae bacterium]